jgi:putative peptide zinc metalloprotease protein
MTSDSLLLQERQLPCLAPGVIIQPYDNAYFLAINIGSGHYLRITKTIASALALADGKTSLVQIHRALNQEDLTLEKLTEIFERELTKFGILASDDEPFETRKFSHIKFKFTLVNVKTVAKISKGLAFIHNPAFAIFSVSSFAFLLAFVCFQNGVVSASLSDQLLIQKHWLIWIPLSFIIGLIHEFGHSSALSSFGGKPREIGFGLYLVFPTFFSSVTDAWRFSKGQRIVVNFGGVYFEVLIATLGLLYFVIFSDPFILVTCFLYLFNIALNLNPFIRSDGYWIISDLTNTPNLTEVSNEILKRLFFGDTQSFKFRNYCLALYSFLSKSYLFIIITLLLFNNFQKIIFFPADLVSSFVHLNFRPIDYQDIREAIPAIIFYLLLFNFIIKTIKRNKTKFFDKLML